MATDARIKANRTNARASTGPKTANGRARSAQNAFKHGLTLHIRFFPEFSAEIEALARELWGRTLMLKSRDSPDRSPKRISTYAGCARCAINSCLAK